MSADDIISGLAPYGLFNEVIGVKYLFAVEVEKRNNQEGSLWSGIILTSALLSHLNHLKSDYAAVL